MPQRLNHAKGRRAPHDPQQERLQFLLDCQQAELGTLCREHFGHDLPLRFGERHALLLFLQAEQCRRAQQSAEAFARLSPQLQQQRLSDLLR